MFFVQPDVCKRYFSNWGFRQLLITQPRAVREWDQHVRRNEVCSKKSNWHHGYTQSSPMVRGVSQSCKPDMFFWLNQMPWESMIRPHQNDSLQKKSDLCRDIMSRRLWHITKHFRQISWSLLSKAWSFHVTQQNILQFSLGSFLPGLHLHALFGSASKQHWESWSKQCSIVGMYRCLPIAAAEIEGFDCSTASVEKFGIYILHRLESCSSLICSLPWDDKTSVVVLEVAFLMKSSLSNCLTYLFIWAPFSGPDNNFVWIWQEWHSFLRFTLNGSMSAGSHLSNVVFIMASY